MNEQKATRWSKLEIVFFPTFGVDFTNILRARCFKQKCFAQLFSSYILALAKAQKHFRTKDAQIKC